MENITKRIAKVWNAGNTLTISLREELLDLGLNTDSEVVVMLNKDKNGKKVIVITKAKPSA